MDLTNQENWNLVTRTNYVVTVTATNPAINGIEYIAVPDKQFYVSSPILMVGVSSIHARRARQKNRRWITGAWASMWLPIIPGSTTDFAPAVHTETIRCKLFQLNLIRFPDVGIYTYILNLAFPWWIEDFSIEVWQYGQNVDGSYTPPPPSDTQSIGEALQRIETKVDNLSQDTFNIDVQ